MMFSSVLIANRGEIALRVMRTLRRLQIRSIAVYSEPDRGSLHARHADEALLIGPAGLHESYLSVERIMAAAERSGAQAIHPGYGFLSESPELARACEAAGIAFIGPSAKTIEMMGDKIQAKMIATAAGVPTVPGLSEPNLSDEQLRAAIVEIGFPALLKPSAGGGGKGMHVIDGDSNVAEVIATARREASSSFGDDALFVERYLASARHLEVQILADTHGHVIHLGERECTLQRRHQKIIEEAPSTFLDDAQRARLGELAITLARAGSYTNAGTVEFIVNAQDADEAYFMEMNSRLQVEHPVTEEVWGIDLVEHQLKIASGEPLAPVLEHVAPKGHAVEARLYAEDPAAGFLPTGGTVLRLREPAASQARVESGLCEGTEVGSSFDPMLAKIVVWAPDRTSALARLDAALGATEILGVGTNTGFLRQLLAVDEVQAGTLDTGLVERVAPSLGSGGPSSHDLAAAAVIDLLLASKPQGVWDLSGWRVSGTAHSSFRVTVGTELVDAELEAAEVGYRVALGDSVHHVRATLDHSSATVEVDDATLHLGVAVSDEGLWLGRAGSAWLFAPVLRSASGALGSAADQVSSPMPGSVTQVPVVAGQRVAEGDVLVVVEAMKMEHALRAPREGVVALVHAVVGDQVRLGEILAELEGA